MPKRDDPFPRSVSRGGGVDEVTGVHVVGTRTAYREDPEYLAHIASQDCWARDCGTECLGDVVAHHHPARGMGNSKGDDRKTAPLCVSHHREVHNRARLGRWNAEATSREVYKAQIHHLCRYLDGQ